MYALRLSRQPARHPIEFTHGGRVAEDPEEVQRCAEWVKFFGMSGFRGKAASNRLPVPNRNVTGTTARHGGCIAEEDPKEEQRVECSEVVWVSASQESCFWYDLTR